MRLLNSREIAFVTGAGGEPTSPPPGVEEPTSETKKNNNGYGNGPESGPAPGNSGAHNPTLLTANSGPKGPR